jgi:hypothetical protein
MPYTVIIHVANEEAFLAEVEALPEPKDNAVFFTNPRKRDGKVLQQFDAEAGIFMYPWWRINYIEVMLDRASRDELVEFFREE